MYHLDTPLENIKGIGPVLAKRCAERGLTTVRDVLLWVPLRYEDRSARRTIAELQPNELCTLVVTVVSSRNSYRGRRSFQTATVKDHTGKLKLFWFNNPHVVAKLSAGTEVFVSGKLNDKGGMTQSTIEKVSTEAIHTGRLVPMYSTIPDIAGGTLRKILKHITDEFDDSDPLAASTGMSLADAFRAVHFPDTEDHVIVAREKLAIEELIGLIQHAQTLKEQWLAGPPGPTISAAATPEKVTSSVHLPFALTGAQERSITEILADLAQPIPMNRLLVGDVGSGKTAVAGMAALACIQSGRPAAFIAPTQILAEQHAATFAKLFPDLPMQLVTTKTKVETMSDKPILSIGTHAILHRLEQLQPALLIYDEQHRFGVRQRSLGQILPFRPHVLTLSATPIPRTMMLTIFQHLQLSVIDELPAGRKEIKTWLTPEAKRSDSYRWIYDQIQTAEHPQVLVVCPFIDPSSEESFAHVASATETIEKVKAAMAEIHAEKQGSTACVPPRIALLHGRQPKPEQSEIIAQLFRHDIDILVTTPIVEVGVDLPAAGIIVIEAAERFGLASLHQMRGRVGRSGQQGYCLLFAGTKSAESRGRLSKFCDIHQGMKLAELDLERRGAGDLFGTQQHGLDELKFASWTNAELIHKAKKLTEEIAEKHLAWKPLFAHQQRAETDQQIPLAN